ncbi:MAG: ATP-binding protein [Methanomassiliicoccaceae archaeon]|nr:ATP-binding protein [Methanomassiliicoccaceae archaeon]
MKFYDRETELEILKETREMSKKGGTFTVITGRRRIGKTALILESEKGNSFLYFFAERKSEAMLCKELIRDTKKYLGIKISGDSFSDLFEELMEYGTKNNFTFVIDEFQELDRADKSITSSIQKHWDAYRSASMVNLIVSGSIYSMMVRIFDRYKEPLFGRATSKFNIRPFKPSVVKRILKDHNPEYSPDDLLFLYMVTGGVPMYIELLMDAGATSFDKMLERICRPNSLFLTEGRDLLISEFGKDYGTYYSILELIATGNNTLREINDAIGKESISYLDNLEKEYNLITRNKPIFSKENSRGIRWHISDNYMRFYFRFIGGNRSLIERGEYGLLKEMIESDYSQYSGFVLENYFKEKMSEEERLTSIGSYWDRKGQNEIDIIAVNDMNMKAVVAEVKRDPKKADVHKLREKSETVYGLKGFDVEFRILSLDDM